MAEDSQEESLCPYHFTSSVSYTGEGNANNNTFSRKNSKSGSSIYRERILTVTVSKVGEQKNVSEPIPKTKSKIKYSMITANDISIAPQTKESFQNYYYNENDSNQQQTNLDYFPNSELNSRNENQNIQENPNYYQRNRPQNDSNYQEEEEEPNRFNEEEENYSDERNSDQFNFQQQIEPSEYSQKSNKFNNDPQKYKQQRNALQEEEEEENAETMQQTVLNQNSPQQMKDYSPTPILKKDNRKPTNKEDDIDNQQKTTRNERDNNPQNQYQPNNTQKSSLTKSRLVMHSKPSNSLLKTVSTIQTVNESPEKPKRKVGKGKNAIKTTPKMKKEEKIEPPRRKPSERPQFRHKTPISREEYDNSPQRQQQISQYSKSNTMKPESKNKDTHVSFVNAKKYKKQSNSAASTLEELKPIDFSYRKQMTSLNASNEIVEKKPDKAEYEAQKKLYEEKRAKSPPKKQQASDVIEEESDFSVTDDYDIKSAIQSGSFDRSTFYEQSDNEGKKQKDVKVQTVSHHKSHLRSRMSMSRTRNESQKHSTSMRMTSIAEPTIHSYKSQLVDEFDAERAKKLQIAASTPLKEKNGKNDVFSTINSSPYRSPPLQNKNKGSDSSSSHSPFESLVSQVNTRAPLAPSPDKDSYIRAPPTYQNQSTEPQQSGKSMIPKRSKNIRKKNTDQLNSTKPNEVSPKIERKTINDNISNESINNDSKQNSSTGSQKNGFLNAQRFAPGYLESLVPKGKSSTSKQSSIYESGLKPIDEGDEENYDPLDSDRDDTYDNGRETEVKLLRHDDKSDDSLDDFLLMEQEMKSKM